MKKIVQVLLLFIFINCLQNFCFAQSDIVITEIMYNQPGNDTLEYIELYNKSSSSVTLDGYTFSQGIEYTFTHLTLGASQYVVLSKYKSFVNSFYNISSIQWTSGSLDNAGEKLVLKNSTGDIVDSVEYDTKNYWPSQANGKGPSLSLCDPNADNAWGYNWAASNNFAGIYLGNPIYGTPGKDNTSCSAQGDIFPPKVTLANAIDVSTIGIKFDEHVSISSSQNTINYSGLGAVISASRIAPDSVVLVLSQPLQFGKIYTLTINGLSDEHIPANTMTSPKDFSLAFNNSTANIKITEIMFTSSYNDTLEFVEVFNAGTQSAQIGGYSFTEGIDFMFPELTLEPEQFYVIPAHTEVYNQFFIGTATCDFKGSLSNVGEKLTIKNSVGTIINSMFYQPEWLTGAPLNTSLSLCDPHSDNATASDWGISANYKGKFMGQDVWASPGEQKSCKITSSINPIEIPKISAFPNPNHGQLSIKFPSSLNRNIIIYDVMGKEVYRTSSENDALTLNLTGLIGLHFIEILDENQTLLDILKISFE